MLVPGKQTCRRCGVQDGHNAGTCCNPPLPNFTPTTKSRRCSEQIFATWCTCKIYEETKPNFSPWISPKSKRALEEEESDVPLKKKQKTVAKTVFLELEELTQHQPQLEDDFLVPVQNPENLAGIPLPNATDGIPVNDVMAGIPDGIPFNAVPAGIPLPESLAKNRFPDATARIPFPDAPARIPAEQINQMENQVRIPTPLEHEESSDDFSIDAITGEKIPYHDEFCAGYYWNMAKISH